MTNSLNQACTSTPKPWVLVPVKAFSRAKTRLANEVLQEFGITSAQLAESMLEDVLHGLAQVPSIGGIAVVSSQPNLRSKTQGIELITEEASASNACGLNAAIKLGIDHLTNTHGVTQFVVLPSDLPSLDPEELDACVTDLFSPSASSDDDANEGSGRSVGLVASLDGLGTNLLAFHAHSEIKPLFGEGSFARHTEQAINLGHPVKRLSAPSIALDIDSVEDLRLCLRTVERAHKDIAPNTRALFASAQLRQLESYCTNQDSTTNAYEVTPLVELMRTASELRDQHFGRLVTYSPKVFIPLTRLCRDVCHYCTFATTPRHLESPYLQVDEVLKIAKEGKRQGCKEALITLGEKPELRYKAAREALSSMGFNSTLEYVAHVADRILQETGLLPHINAGCMTFDELQKLKSVSASMGIMLENVSPRLCDKGMPHFGSPDKNPVVRLKTLIDAGLAKVPMTTGILVGIGETRQERIASLVAIRDINQQYGHIQEVIVQNFVAKENTKMAEVDSTQFDDLLWTVAVARIILGGEMSIQVPPNLNAGNLEQLIDAGINDWGGVSPLTPDYVNPESPWPHLEKLAGATAKAGKLLQQRLTIYPDYISHKSVGLKGEWLASSVRPAVLALVDGEGLAREDSWLTGVSKKPALNVRQSVLHNSPISVSDPISIAISELLSTGTTEPACTKAMATLFRARGDDFTEVCRVADRLRQQTNGENVSYVINRNINYTNICNYSCSFCAFSKGKKNTEDSDAPYLKSLDEIAALAVEAVENGATEVCLQGGIHPHFTGQTYLDICQAVHDAEPHLHIHAFSPLEVWHGADTLGISVKDFLIRLRAVGLRSLPGTAAEILHDEVRAEICPDKLNTQQWLHVIETAHEVGLRTTATIMFGHVDDYEHWAEHLSHIRQLQQRTGGITEFVPLPFVANEAPIFKRGRARSGPTLRESILMHAVARIALHGVVNNIQTSWVKMGLEGAMLCLHAGVNDVGGVLMNESITRAAGAKHGQMLQAVSLHKAISAADRQPVQRTTLYQPLESDERGIRDFDGVSHQTTPPPIPQIAI